MNTFDKELVRETGADVANWDASTAITTQAHVFDAIAKVITSDDDNTALVEGILGLVRDDDLLPDMKRRGVPDAAIEKLAPTVLFCVVIDAKYVAGPRLLLYVEFVSFLVVMFCFARVATFDVLGWSDPWLLASKTVEKAAALCVAFAVLVYFSAREVGQIRSARAIELAKPEDLISKKRRFDPKSNDGLDSEDFIDYYETEGLAWYALATPRYFLLFVVCLLLYPVFRVIKGLDCAGKRYEWMKLFYVKEERRKPRCLKEVAPTNIQFISHTLDTFQSLSGWSKDLAP